VVTDSHSKYDQSNPVNNSLVTFEPVQNDKKSREKQDGKSINNNVSLNQRLSTKSQVTEKVVLNFMHSKQDNQSLRASVEKSS